MFGSRCESKREKKLGGDRSLSLPSWPAGKVTKHWILNFGSSGTPKFRMCGYLDVPGV